MRRNKYREIYIKWINDLRLFLWDKGEEKTAVNDEDSLGVLKENAQLSIYDVNTLRSISCRNSFPAEGYISALESVKHKRISWYEKNSYTQAKYIIALVIVSSFFLVLAIFGLIRIGQCILGTKPVLQVSTLTPTELFKVGAQARLSLSYNILVRVKESYGKSYTSRYSCNCEIWKNMVKVVDITIISKDSTSAKELAFVTAYLSVFKRFPREIQNKFLEKYKVV